jgi:hypothetical protein
MIYAEQILLEKQCNQWFIWFNIHQPGWDETIKTQHWEWFHQNQVTVTQVGGLGDRAAKGDIYHVDFQDSQDARLAAYSNEWETPWGDSKIPIQYQMLEWNYAGWLEHGGPRQFEEWLQSP